MYVFVYLYIVNIQQTLGDCNVKHILHCTKENVVTYILCKVRWLVMYSKVHFQINLVCGNENTKCNAKQRWNIPTTRCSFKVHLLNNLTILIGKYATSILIISTSESEITISILKTWKCLLYFPVYNMNYGLGSRN